MPHGTYVATSHIYAMHAYDVALKTILQYVLKNWFNSKQIHVQYTENKKNVTRVKTIHKKTGPDRFSNSMLLIPAESAPGTVVTNGIELCHFYCS